MPHGSFNPETSEAFDDRPRRGVFANRAVAAIRDIDVPARAVADESAAPTDRTNATIEIFRKVNQRMFLPSFWSGFGMDLGWQTLLLAPCIRKRAPRLIPC